MIKIITGQFNNLEYDVRGIVSSFYPGEDIEFFENVSAAEGGSICRSPESVSNHDLELSLALDQILTDPALSKNELRKQLYNYLKAQTGKDLPWGILIGVRPTKLTMKALQGGMSLAEAEEYMMQEYFVSEKKAKLAVNISQKEIEVMKRLEKEPEPYNLYIGIPFCPTTCLYCSFTSYPIGKWHHRVPDYLEAVFKELDWTAERFKNQPCHSVYIGGGTPTSLTAEELELVLARIREKIDFSTVLEFTVEAGRPDSISRDKLEVMKKYGVSRISINPQTMNDKTLKTIGRSHKAEQIVESFNMARELGFDDINMDIILGLPGERAEDVEYTMKEIAKLRPDNLTVHALAVKRASRLKMESAGAVMPGYSEEESARMMEVAESGALAMGLSPYYMYRQKNMAGNLENVGYAVSGKEGIYNIVIIEETESIVALGAGTVTKRLCPDGSLIRCDCAKEVDDYINRIDEMIERKRQLFA